jgi:hypothetical protein
MKIRQNILSLLPVRFRFALRYMACHRRFSLLVRPTLFTEKNMLRVALDRRNILRTCADKLTMRELIKAKAGDGFLPEILCVANDPAKIHWEKLPNRFVMKGSHGSGFVKVVEGFDAACQASVETLVDTANEWLEVDYGERSREWAYKGISRNIIIEGFIDSDCKDKDDVPWDFKLFVFDGKCAMIQVDTGRFADHRMNLFSRSWEPFNCTYKDLYAESNKALVAPANLDEMIKVAEQVGRGIDFVRVDLYSTEAGPIVGEMTMTPGGGIEVKFTDPSLDRLLGKQWQQAKFTNSTSSDVV